MKLINLTPHSLQIQIGERKITLLSKGSCRVAVKQTPCSPIAILPGQAIGDLGQFGIDVPVVIQEYGEVEGLPEPQEDTFYVVSLVVLQALYGKRLDVLAPDTGKTAIRDVDGKIIAVTQFVR